MVKPKFIADVMLGKLAKWLRIAGFDVAYSNDIEDDQLVLQARAEDRVILTRDTRLVQRNTVKKHLLIEHDRVEDQIRQVMKAFRIRAFPALFSRCLICNEELEEVAREEIKDQVPPYVYRTRREFARCPRCSRIYWAGTHLDHARSRIRRLRL
ncbi:MAG: Mut7-C RNAse domain-containing protein [Acidobacteria bacterium]|nr:Mut7-C RNAse domain-containing protein [Acidobacteriota bacterium]